ncbi:hypothetical protein T4A_1488 [Trichinella pseudospiralis]|uniref:Uncharacterized protein n=1 Tax=Trichinella pseudospiralis TaxID=6337 RepID=A0A0V1K8K8_TRIPS|nr:hypothetical protein T4A_1488 [Trichinella pseudospiralis]KRY93586.1 hypothetical protein T4D_10836 [Trichinella pseudospiralis]KRZ43432.1 hypothetical protein T4C_5524 [Trichinella pseudospiralis]
MVTMDFETLKRRRCGLKDRAICLCRDLGTFMREDAHDAMEVIIVDDEEGRNDMLKWIDFESEEITTSLAMAKLSTWNFPKFSRNVFELASFVEQFRVAIHNKIELDDLTKFVYLRSLLEGEGLKSIKGYAVTSKNCSIAMRALEKSSE